MMLRMGSNPSAAKCSVVTTLMTSRRPQLVLIDSAIRMDKMGHVKVKIDLLNIAILCDLVPMGGPSGMRV
jgi:hypothetical protein